jgi:hypothetical protein
MLGFIIKGCTASNDESDYHSKGKVKTSHKGPKERAEVYLYSLLNRGTRWGGWSTPCPAALFVGKTQYPLYRELGGPQERSGWVRKISPQLGPDPQTAQPVASRYTD